MIFVILFLISYVSRVIGISKEVDAYPSWKLQSNDTGFPEPLCKAVGHCVSTCLNLLLRSNGARTSLSVCTLTSWTRNTPLYHCSNFIKGSRLIAAQRLSHAMQWLKAFCESAVCSDLISFISLSLLTMWFEIFEILWTYLHLFPHLLKIRRWENYWHC